MSIGRVPGATGIQPSIVTAKGDLIVATASGSVTNQAVGSNNQVLTADSAQADGVKWANGSAATLTTTGDILYASAANTPARLGIGSTSQVLTVSGGVPTWATPSSGGMTLITSGNLSSSGVTLSSITSAYTDLYLYVYGVKFDTAGKYIGVWVAGASSTIPNQRIVNNNLETDNYIRFGTSQQYLSGNMSLGILFKNYTGTAGSKPVFFAGNSNDGTNNNRMTGGGATSTTSAISSISVENAPGGGNITAGSYELWGIK